VHRKSDAIAIVEAAYNLEGDNRAWLTRVLEQAAPRLDRGFGTNASVFHPRSGIDESTIVTLGMSDEVHAVLLEGSRTLPDLARRMYAPNAVIATATQNLGMTEAEALSFPPFAKRLHPIGVRDLLGVFAVSPDGAFCTLSAPIPDVRRPSKKEVARWGMITAHIAAAARLRRAIGALPDLSDGADAILSASGVVAYAEPSLQGVGARESLRRAAHSIDRARSKARANEEEALGLWQGLVAGRWSLLEQFDTDGRRFLVARRNDPQVGDPRALTLRERQVLAYVGMGHSIKLIAYTLGLSMGSVSGTRTRAMRKLGLRTQADLAKLFAAQPQ
jgi:DNA-binding CsgD family transcriptional regulator